MSNRQKAKEIVRGKDVIGNFLKNVENYGKKKHTGWPPTVSMAGKWCLIRNSANSLKPAGQLKTENHLSIGVRRVRQILNASNHLKYKKKRTLKVVKIFRWITFIGLINGVK